MSYIERSVSAASGSIPGAGRVGCAVAPTLPALTSSLAAVSCAGTDALKQQKGVLLPNLGTFTVGPVVGETRKKVRPAFALLDTRYASVSQERARYTVGKSWATGCGG